MCIAENTQDSRIHTICSFRRYLAQSERHVIISMLYLSIQDKICDWHFERYWSIAMLRRLTAQSQLLIFFHCATGTTAPQSVKVRLDKVRPHTRNFLSYIPLTVRAAWKTSPSHVVSHFPERSACSISRVIVIKVATNSCGRRRYCDAQESKTVLV